MGNSAVAMFVQEAQELLEGLEDMLLDLENSASLEKVDSVFRALHTIKGSGAMFGFNALSEFTHHFENAFDLVREGQLTIDNNLIDLSLRARDVMRTLLEPDVELTGEEARIRDEIVAAMDRLTASAGAPGAASPSAAENAGPRASEGKETFDIFFCPAAESLINGTRPDLLIEELAGLGELSVEIDMSDVPPLPDLDPTHSYLKWQMVLTTDKGEEAVRDVFIFTEDADLKISRRDPEEQAEIEQGAQPEASGPAAGAKPPLSGASIRVDSGRLDDMMDRLGELVIVHARLEQISRRIADPMLETVAEEIDRLVTGLRDTTLSIRMLPIETVFGKFRRVVRDLSNELGKKVELITDGGETEIDKNVIDKLTEPLVHMIRNSIDHGIGDEAERLAVGKQATGQVRLSAMQEGGEVLISIIDDGKGLDKDKIRQRAIERGVIDESDTLSDNELFQLIFAPGFSTAEALTSISGRGVGMDAVKTTVDMLRGSIDIDSTPGKGTSITLRLPVSLAIIDGLLVRLGEAVYVIPLASVEECVELDRVESRRESGRTMLQIRESLVPFLDLKDVFSLDTPDEDRRRVVIVRADGAQLGLVVDDILGQNQTVIKTLSVFHRDVLGFAGATILGDGTVALIIDVAILMRTALRERAISPGQSLDARAGA